MEGVQMNIIQGMLRWHPRASTAKVGRFRLLAFVGVVAGLGVFASGATAQTGATTKPTLRIAATYSYDQFWSHFGLYAAAGREGALLTSINYAPLIHETPGGKLVPALATSWKVLKSKRGPNREFEVILRKGAKFADGSPVNAAAVAAYWTWFAKTNGAYGGLVGPKPVFEAVGATKVIARLTVPTPHFFALNADTGPMWGWVASSRCVADPANTWPKGDCGAGPFMLDAANSVKGSIYKWVPNPNYYDKANLKWGALEQRVIPLVSSQLQALQSGQIDIAAVGNDSSSIKAAADSGQKVYWASVTQYVVQLKQNGVVPSPLTNTLVRQALNYSLDRKALADAMGAGYSKPISQFQTLDAVDPKSASAYPYNPTRSKALLAQAGYPNGFSFKTYTFNPQAAQFQSLVAKYFGDVGVKMDVVPSSPANSTALFFQSPVTSSQLTMEITPVSYRWFNKSYPASTVSDTASSALYIKGLKSANPIPSYQAMWARATDQAFFLPVATLPLVYFASPKVAGINVAKKRTGSIMVTELSPK
jgi:peptide/nickel transport system substrate-binding protein